jgi:hypothetical protein
MVPFSGRDGITWHPVSTIEKYSSDQVAWARARQAQSPLRGALAGGMLRRMFSQPEDGIVRDEGNGVTLAGTGNLALVLTGRGGHPLGQGRAVFGVGGDATAFDREHVHLSPVSGEEQGWTWYRPMDAGYPAVTRPGVIEGQATFAESEACFEWHEWCWGTGPLTPEPHHSLRGAYAGEQPVMMNRRAHPAGYGEKLAGVAWVFRTEIMLS